MFLILSIAVGLTAYPYIANYIFENRADSIVNTLEQSSNNTDEAEREAAFAAAQQYNEKLVNGHVQLKDPFVEKTEEEDTAEYNSLLVMNDEGVMGFIEIPSIKCHLPIYHGTSEKVLEMGAGHLQGTSLPIGGESTHCVLTGHTGLSNAKLFTDLTALEDGDIFFLNVMGKKLAYKVNQIKVVLPSELDDLVVEREKDYCTLITCTPYGVNTHRLLVRGERTDYEDVVENPNTFRTKKVESEWMAEYQRALLISLACFVLGMVVLVAVRYWIASREVKEDGFC